MRVAPIALASLIVSICTASSSLAEPPPCNRVRQALERGADPARVAKVLDTTRARVNACAKIGENQERMDGRRLELHRQRGQRGLDH